VGFRLLKDRNFRHFWLGVATFIIRGTQPLGAVAGAVIGERSC
jgi:hypothetical protein